MTEVDYSQGSDNSDGGIKAENRKAKAIGEVRGTVSRQWSQCVVGFQEAALVMSG